LDAPNRQKAAPACGRTIAVYVLCRNRILYLPAAISSVLSQGIECRVILSDNSTTTDVEQFVRESSFALEYRRRSGNLNAIEHLNTVLDEVEEDYFMLFHDDDVMLPSCVATLAEVLDAHPDVFAVGSNAYCIFNERHTKQTFFKVSGPTETVLLSGEELAERYMRFKGRVAPFPSYMYRRKGINGLRIRELEGGKYADASFLVKIASLRSLLWYTRPLISYRMHGAQDSSKPHLKARVRSCQFLARHVRPEARQRMKDQYRFQYWSQWLYRSAAFPPTRKQLRIAMILTGYAVAHPRSCLGFVSNILYLKLQRGPSL
jgi:glycosyltransferase involved in cell wall biosynthesis